MAKYVKVSTVNVQPCHVKLKPDNMDIVNYVIANLERNINQVLPDAPDLIVLPEVCDRPEGFANIHERLDYYAYRGDKVLHYLQKKARENNCYITYAAQIVVDGIMRNCCQMIGRKGEIVGIYKKNYPVIRENTDLNIMAGSEATIFECDFGRVGAVICFDMNFDEYRQRMKEQKPDLVVFTSGFHGSFLQNYFAYDTRSYLVSSVGYAQIHGGIISPVGEKIAETTTYYNHLTMTLNMDYEVCHLDYHLGKLAELKAKYGPKVKIHDPGDLGSVLISSETEECSVHDMLKEFDIITLDEYIRRSIAHRNQCIAE